MRSATFYALCVNPTCTVAHALRRLDETAKGVLLVLDSDNRLLRTLTDGDLRRAHIQGVDGNAQISSLAARAPLTVGEHANAQQAMALMDANQIDQIPVVDGNGRPIDIVFRRELTQRVWLSSPHLGEEETAFVEDAFRTNWIAPLGPHVDAFEKELAAHVGVAHAAALSSGTAAIHLGLLLLGVKPGDRVFCSSLTFVASCNPILYCGAQPVLIDSEPGSWNMSPAALERAFVWAQANQCMPRCVVIVNLYGQSADMDNLLPICERYGVPVLEDAAESLGASYRGRKSGSFGRMAVYSFNGNKIITTSGGGMLVADDPALIARARKLSTQSREVAAHYEHAEIGFNYRMSNVLAGIGRGQLRVLTQRVAQRRAVFERYREALADVPEIEWMPEPEDFFSTRWLTCFTLNGPYGPARCEALMRSMERHQIEVRPVWKPMHRQPLFSGAPYFEHAIGNDVSRRLFETGVCLPSGSNLTLEQQERVIAQLRLVLGAPDS